MVPALGKEKKRGKDMRGQGRKKQEMGGQEIIGQERIGQESTAHCLIPAIIFLLLEIIKLHCAISQLA